MSLKAWGQVCVPLGVLNSIRTRTLSLVTWGQACVPSDGLNSSGYEDVVPGAYGDKFLSLGARGQVCAPRGCSAAPGTRTPPPREQEPLGVPRGTVTTSQALRGAQQQPVQDRVPKGTGTGLSPSFPLMASGTRTLSLGAQGHTRVPLDWDVGDWDAGGQDFGTRTLSPRAWGRVGGTHRPGGELLVSKQPGQHGRQGRVLRGQVAEPQGGGHRGVGTVTPSSGSGVSYLRLLLRLRLALPHGCRGALPMQEAAEKGGKRDKIIRGSPYGDAQAEQ